MSRRFEKLGLMVLVAAFSAAPAYAKFYPVKGRTDAPPSPVRIAVNDAAACTATFISNSGHLLTARHCILGCRDQQCSVSVTDPNDRETHYDKFKVIATGKGRALWELKGDSANDWNVVSKILREDFAIIQIPVSSPCSPISDKPTTVGTPVAMYAWPLHTFRSDTFDSDGEHEYFSTSEIVEDQRPAVDGLFWSSLDLVPSASGSSSMDSDLKIIGVNSATPDSDIERSRNYYREKTAISISASRIRARVEEMLGKDRAAEVFSCKQ